MINRNHAPLRAPEHGWDTVMHEYAQKTLMGLGGIWVNQLLVMLMMIVNMAAYPLVVKAMEQQGFHASSKRPDEERIAASFGCFALYGYIDCNGSTVCLSARLFPRESIPFLPYIAVGAFLNGLQVLPLRPRFPARAGTTIGRAVCCWHRSADKHCAQCHMDTSAGDPGAAWATLAACAVALVTSIVLGKRVFPVPFHWKGVAQVLAAAFAMLCVWIVLPHADSPVSHMLHAGGGIIAYGGTLALLQVMMPHVHGKPKCSSTRRVQID